VQKIKVKLSLLLTFVAAVGAGAMHLVQLLKQLDSAESSSSADSLGVYILILLGFVFSIIYASQKKDLAKVFDFEKSTKSIYWAAGLLSVTFFYDFLHQGYNCYSYVSRVSYVEYAYIVPLGISCLFALLSCFYFLTLAITAQNSNYDFRNFTLLHFSPVIWAFVKLLSIMLQIVDVRVNVDVSCEFILLCVVLCFLLSMISGIDKMNAPASRMFAFSSIMTAFMAIVTAIPKAVIVLMGKGDDVGSTTFSCVTYIMLGAFSLTLMCDIVKRSKLKQ
jgi:hypothetical protein